jgi:hypothetical protein
VSLAELLQETQQLRTQNAKMLLPEFQKNRLMNKDFGEQKESWTILELSGLQLSGISG